MNQKASNGHDADHAPPTHQVLADGVIIYEGDDWQEVFKEASKNPEYGEIIHMCNGEPGAQWKAPLGKTEQG